MDKSLRNVIVAGGVFLILLGGLAGVGSAYADADVEAARNRLRTTMGKVTRVKNPNVGDNRQQPEIPDLKGIVCPMFVITEMQKSRLIRCLSHKNTALPHKKPDRLRKKRI